jgi:hypothetical protein
VFVPGRDAAFFTLLRRTGTIPNLGVIAGLDPAIHPFRKSPAKMMDARVKPAHDGVLL